MFQTRLGSFGIDLTPSPWSGPLATAKDQDETLEPDGYAESNEDSFVDDEADDDEPDFDLLAKRTYLPTDFLESVWDLLQDKRQVIFQGPPGTGKTYIAQELAEVVAELGP